MPTIRRLLLPLLCLLLVLAGAAPATAAPQDPPGRLLFQSHAREAGLGNLRINLLVQDGTGFLWAGTDRGLFRFDGQRFTAFGLAEGLPALEVNALQLDAQGVLWAGTTQGLARFDGRRFVRAAGLAESLSVEELAVGPDRLLWVGTRDGPFRGGAAGFAPVPGWPGGVAYSMALQPRGSVAALWVGSRRSLAVWTVAEGWQAAPAELAVARGEHLDRLAADPAGRVFARTSQATYVLEPGGAAFLPLPGLPRAETLFSRLHVDTEGGVWLPTEKGVHRFHQGQLQRIGLDEGLPTEFARSVLLDREGNLWVGSLGLHRLLGRGAWRSHTPKEGLPADVWSLLRDRDGQLWVGTGKGLARADGARWRVLPGTEGLTVRAVVQRPDGSLVFGGEPYGLHRWDPATRRLQALPELPDGGRKVLSLAQQADGTLWIGTQRDGLLRATDAGGGWRIERQPLPGGQPRERISDLALDRRGQLWIAGSDGLAQRRDAAWVRFGTADGLASANLIYLAASRDDDSLWLAYAERPGELARVSTAPATAGRLLQQLGPPRLPAVDLTLVGEDGRGRLWTGSSQGLEMLAHARTASGAAPTHFGVERGLVDEEVNARAFLADADGGVWIGTRGGLVHFDSSRYDGDPAPPRVAVLQLRVGDEEVPPPAGAAGFETPHDRNSLQLRFAALSFTDQSGLHYQTSLEGLDGGWVDSPTREVRYAGLAPGEYRLQLRARYRDGEWGPITQLGLQVHPAWWQTTAFKLALAAALMLALWLLERRRVLRDRQEKAQLEALVQSRTQALAVANEQLRQQSLTDPLTRLHNRRYLNEVMGQHVAQVDRALRSRVLRQARLAPPGDGLVLVMVDMDHFKSVNDEHGHAAGDLVLQQMAELLRECTRESDTVARWGGEEFAIVGRQASPEDAPALVERIRSRVEAHGFDIGGGTVLRCSCSIGFSVYPFIPAEPQRLPWERLFELADRCLYVAKRSGRNRAIGVQPRLDRLLEAADVEHLCARLDDDLAGLVEEGWLDVLGCRAGEPPPDWRQA
jgi:diguanylate cyclase (GGDEF)-like protein